MALTHSEAAGHATYMLDAEAQIAASRANYRRQIFSRRVAMRMAIAVVLFAGIGAVLGVVLDEDPVWLALLCAGEVLVFFPVLFVALYFQVPRRVRRLVNQSAIWREPVSVTWSTAGVSSHSANGTTELGWADYHGWHESRSGFLLYFNDQQYQVVPASALAPGEADALRATITASGLKRL